MRPAIMRKLRTMPTSRMPTICMSPIIQRRQPNFTSNITARSNAFELAVAVMNAIRVVRE